jgi:iron complex outermembrane recepter protein
MTPTAHSASPLLHPRLRPTALAALACLLSGLHAPHALAQTPTADTALETVVVTGSTRERKLTDVPYAITSVGTEALRNSGPMVNLSESMARVPGLVVANRNNYAQDLQISSRGFGARAGFGVRGLRLYADGIPASMPDGQGQVAHFDLAGAERVEVLRGPFSALYGNASGGVIALFSKPVRERQFEVGVDAGSFGLRQGRVSVAAPLGDGFDVSASLSKLSIDGFRPQSGADRQLATARLGWKGDHDRVTLTVSDQNQTADDPLGLTRAQFDANPDQTTPEAAQYGTRKVIRQTQAGASWTHQFTDAGPLARTQLTGYTGSRGVMQFLAISPATQANVRHGGAVVDFDRQYHGADARALWHWDTVDLTAGVNVEQQLDDRRGYNNYTGAAAAPTALGVQGTLRRNETNRADTRETYAQADWTLATDWQASLGVRSGRVRMRVDDSYLGNGDDSGEMALRYTNPVAGLRWKASSALTLHAAASRGHESPTLGELAYRPDGNSGFNTDLQAQTSRQIELGAKWREGGVSLDATVFRIDTDQEIGVATNSGGRSSFRNVGRTERFGAELAAGWRVVTGLRAQLALTLLQAQYADDFRTCTAIPCTLTAATNTTTVPAGNRIAGTQPASAYAELAWTTPWSADAEAAVEWRAQGRTAVNDTNTDFAGGYGLFNLRYSHRWMVDEAGSLQLLARLDNVAGRRTVGSVIVNDGNGRYFEPGAPRSAVVSLRYLRRF